MFLSPLGSNAIPAPQGAELIPKIIIESLKHVKERPQKGAATFSASNTTQIQTQTGEI